MVPCKHIHMPTFTSFAITSTHLKGMDVMRHNCKVEENASIFLTLKKGFCSQSQLFNWLTTSRVKETCLWTYLLIHGIYRFQEVKFNLLETRIKFNTEKKCKYRGWLEELAALQTTITRTVNFVLLSLHTAL